MEKVRANLSYKDTLLIMDTFKYQIKQVEKAKVDYPHLAAAFN